MHTMVIKRYMRKCDTCVGHETHINKLLLKKPPGIMSADSASSVCEQCANKLSKAVIEKEGEEEKQKTTNMQNIDGGRRRTQNPVLGVESSETGCVPWVRLESVTRCISQAVRSTSQDLVNYEGTFPLGLELVLFLLR